MNQSSSSAAIRRQDVGLRSERGPILLSMLLSTSLIALDATILATAVPSVVADLGGFAQFPWLFSIYTLAQAITVPIYAKLSDMFGRKPIMIIGIATFLVGSVLCGLAWNMVALIVFRGLQGLGAGAIQPTAMTIVADVYTIAERAKIQGHLASVWAISAVLGPTLGGLFVDYLHWRLIFWINVPIGGIALWFLLRRFTEQHARSTHRVDIGGAILLTIGGTCLILGLLEGGVLWPWVSLPSLAVFAVGILALIAFSQVERRVTEPILSGWIFTRRLLNTTNLISFFGGVILLGLTSYIPLYAQSVLHHSALVAGFALAAMTLGWPLAASQSGRFYLRIGFRGCALVGSIGLISGAALLMLLRPTSSIWHVAITCFVIGLGMGLIMSPTMIAAQSAFPRHQRGVVTGTNMFARSIGSSVGVAVLGTIVNASVGAQLGEHSSGTESLPPEVLAPALQQAFGVAVVGVIAVVIAVVAMPGRLAPPEQSVR